MAVTLNADGWAHHQYSADQVANIVAETGRRPIFLVEVVLDGTTTEYFSCSGRSVTYDSTVYASGMNIKRIDNNKSASLSLEASATRAAEVLNQKWRYGTCKVRYIPALASDGDTFVAADAVLLVDGLVDSCRYDLGSMEITCINKYLTGSMSPALTFNDVCSHLPPAGFSFEWENEFVSLEEQAALIDWKPILKGLL